MSYTFTLNDKSSELKATIYPPIVLSESHDYVIGLINFVSYNSIPNVDETNNRFHFGVNNIIILPPGCYEISDINHYLQKYIIDNYENNPLKGQTDRPAINISLNRTTLRSEVKCTEPIDFQQNCSIAQVLGFTPQILAANKKHISNKPINIFRVNAINIECNLVQNSYSNDEKKHILHVFYPKNAPGTKIVENPSNVIYLPINTKFINEIAIKLTDQEGNLVNFNGEVVTVRLHVKKIYNK